MPVYKTPVSVLVVIHTIKMDVLLLERALYPGYWQSVTGSQETSETLLETACRELYEETGLKPQDGRLCDWKTSHVFEIFPEWRHRYAPQITHNTEHVFSFMLEEKCKIKLSDEHRQYLWLPYREAAEKCFSWSNRETIVSLGNSGCSHNH